MNYQVIVGMPAYNEEAVLGKLLDQILQLQPIFEDSLKVYVVNDGSADHTGDILRTYSSRFSCINYLTHFQNKGLGAAIKTLFAAVHDLYGEDDVLVTLDADNTHSPRIIPEMIKKLHEENLDIVIASRFISGAQESGLSLNRKIYSRGATCLLKLFFPIPNVRDYSCGYRAYRIGYLKRAMDLYHGQLITSSGFECMAEILARFSKIGVAAGEYPLNLQYELKVGKSKMKVMRTVMGYFRLVGKVKPPLVH